METGSPERDVLVSVCVRTHGLYKVLALQACCGRGYNVPMKQKPLSGTNPYLRDPAKLRKALIKSVASSTAIETGASVARMLEENALSTRPKQAPRQK